MRQNDIFYIKKFNLPRWATPIICGFLLGSAAGTLRWNFCGRPAQQQWPSTTADPRRDPITQSNPTGIPGIHHQSEVDRTGAVERPDVRMLRYPVLLGPLRLIAVVDRQQQRKGHLPVLVHTLWRLYAIYVYTVYIFYTSNRICIVLQRTYIFGTWYV